MHQPRSLPNGQDTAVGNNTEQYGTCCGLVKQSLKFIEAHKTKLEIHMIKFEVCIKVSIIVEFDIIYIEFLYYTFVRLILNCLRTFI